VRKLVVILVIFSAGCLMIGVPGMWNVIRYRHPVVVTELAQDPTDLPGYVHLKEMRLRGMEATIVSSRRGSRIFVPVRHQQAPPSDKDKVTIMLESDDPALLEAVTRMGGKADLAKILKQLGVFDQKTEATGMVHRIEYDAELQAILSDYKEQLAEHAVVVREGESPSLGLAVLTLSVAAVMIALLNWIRTRPSRQAEEPPLMAEPPLLPPKP
jgi:hypothetical protein